MKLLKFIDIQIALFPVVLKALKEAREILADNEFRDAVMEGVTKSTTPVVPLKEIVVREKAPQKRKKRKTNGNPEKYMKILIDIFQSNGNVLMNGEALAKKLKKMKIEVNSANIPNYISTIMWRNYKVFERVEKGKYRLKEKK